MAKGRWEDMLTYWAWRESPEECKARQARSETMPPLPSKKRLDYVTINKGRPTEMKLCIGVWDNEVYTPLSRDELEFHLVQHGG